MRKLIIGFILLSFHYLATSQVLDPGTIGSDQQLCYSSKPMALTQTPPSGGTPTYKYQWQRSNDNGITWISIKYAQKVTYSLPLLVKTALFRRRVTDGVNHVKYSKNVNDTSRHYIIINVLPKLKAGTIGSAQTICAGTAPTALSELPGLGASGGSCNGNPDCYHYKWQSSTDGLYWTDINGATSAVFAPSALTVDTWYRRFVIDGSCGSTSSNSVKITVIANLNAGTIGYAQTICYNTAPSTLTELTSPSGGTGQYTYQWQISTNGSDWSDIQGANSTGYTPSALTVDTWYRRRVIDGSCGSTSSSSVKITVNPQITLAQLHDNVTIENNASTNINVIISGGTSPYTINYARNREAQEPIPNYISSTSFSTGTLSTGTLATGTYIYNLTSVTDINGCSAQNLGTSITVTVVSAPTIFTNEFPSSFSNNNQYDLGTEFQVLADGFITRARLYSYINEGGDHTVRLWKLNGSVYTLVSGPYTWNFSSGVQGWREFELPSSVAVVAGNYYIISITNSSTDLWYSSRANFISTTDNGYLKYIRGLYTTLPGEVPQHQYSDNCYFRDIVFTQGLVPGSIGTSQSICYNTVPAALTEIAAPMGGTGVYSFQWQNSPDNSTWADIPGANSSGYSPPALTINTYYRRSVTSGGYIVNSSSIFITLYALVTLVQLHDNITIYNNTSTNLNVVISGGTSPYTINYRRNGEVQTPVQNYSSGTDISTGVMTTGTYIYTLTSVVDANGCNSQSLGNSITVEVSGSYLPGSTNKALVIVNQGSANYLDYSHYIKPYLDNFGIPYDVYDSPTPAGLTELSNYALIIFGHKNVYDGVTTKYPITQLETAITGGVGLYSFDSHLFDYSSAFTILETQQERTSNNIDIVTNPIHYITQYHIDDAFNSTNDAVTLLSNMTTDLSTYGLNGIDLARINTAPLLQVASYGSGRIVKWNGYDWMFDNVLGPVYGMDDLIWRGIVWAARKPFVMKGLPPMITMRVDDVDGSGYGANENFGWVTICNEFGFIPWMGTFNEDIPLNYIANLKYLIDNKRATAAPHASGYYGEVHEFFIYFNHFGDTFFYPADSVIKARNFYVQNSLTMSKFLVPHYYEISHSALKEIHDMGIEFIGTHILYDNSYYSSWLNCGPYRINRYGPASDSRPVYYADNVHWEGYDFFNCIAEIRDDGGYEWYPSGSDISGSIARGVRQLRRSLNSMVLPTLFTHERYLDMTSNSLRQILGGITPAVSSYNPEYRSMDYAAKYIRAKEKITLTNVTNDDNLVNISYSGVNDMDTKCYLFTESGNQISYRLILLPQISSGTITVSVLK